MAHQENSCQHGSSPIKTILIVEDDPDIGEFLTLALSQETPYHAILVTDGFQALTIVKRLKPQLFLLDDNLPAMRGLALYDHLHTTAGLEDVPAIFISANLPQEELEKRQVSFLEKPFELDQLLYLVDQFLAQ